jgi:hypothetical protein
VFEIDDGVAAAAAEVVEVADEPVGYDEAVE